MPLELFCILNGFSLLYLKGSKGWLRYQPEVIEEFSRLGGIGRSMYGKFAFMTAFSFTSLNLSLYYLYFYIVNNYKFVLILITEVIQYLINI